MTQVGGGKSAAIQACHHTICRTFSAIGAGLKLGASSVDLLVNPCAKASKVRIDCLQGTHAASRGPMILPLPEISKAEHAFRLCMVYQLACSPVKK